VKYTNFRPKCMLESIRNWEETVNTTWTIISCVSSRLVFITSIICQPQSTPITLKWSIDGNWFQIIVGYWYFIKAEMPKNSLVSTIQMWNFPADVFFMGFLIKLDNCWNKRNNIHTNFLQLCICAPLSSEFNNIQSPFSASLLNELLTCSLGNNQ